MVPRPVAAVLLFAMVVPFYCVYWLVRSKDEMVVRGADIPSAWWLVVPIANLFWLWKWAAGVEYVSIGRTSQLGAFLVVVMLGFIGIGIVQNVFNEDAREPLPTARIL